MNKLARSRLEPRKSNFRTVFQCTAVVFVCSFFNYFWYFYQDYMVFWPLNSSFSVQSSNLKCPCSLSNKNVFSRDYETSDNLLLWSQIFVDFNFYFTQFELIIIFGWFNKTIAKVDSCLKSTKIVSILNSITLFWTYKIYPENIVYWLLFVCPRDASPIKWNYLIIKQWLL